MLVKIIIILFTGFAQDNTYYVDISGSDDSTCGAATSPCASINQVITNQPGASYTVSISEGIFETSQIDLQKSAFVIFQGTENPSIEAKWDVRSFVLNTNSSGFEFRDLLLYLFGDGGTDFSRLNGAGNSVGFYNVKLIFVGFIEAHLYNFIDSYGGSLILSNISCNVALLDSFFIIDRSNGEASNISVVNSNFTNMNIEADGGFFVFDGYGPASVLIDSTNFNRIGTDEVFIGFWTEDKNQSITVTNNIFTNVITYLPCIYVQNNFQCVLNIQNTSWTNVTADFVSGGIEIIGPSYDGQDLNITLDSLTFVNCNGNFAGAVLVAFNSLALSNSAFVGNTGSDGYGNDVVQALDSNTAGFKFVITNSTSSSALPKAGIWDVSTDVVTDMSEQLPDPPRNVIVRHLTRKDISALPKFARKKE